MRSHTPNAQGVFLRTNSLKAVVKHASFSELETNIPEVIGLKDTICICGWHEG